MHCARSSRPKAVSPASIIIVTFNNLALNQGCLQSIFGKTDWPNFEVLVVDNASSDGTAQWLLQEAAHEPRLRVILNTDNRGFSAANNQGLRAAHGEHLCLLNNDTVVTRGWLSTLIGHLRKTPELGMIGPVSNMVGNEAKIPVGYAEIAKMPPWAAAHCRQHDGETVPIIMLGFFCVVLCREVYEKVGELDEQFGTGYFEDTDYCCRVRRQGYELRYALDAFVHHWQGASFRLLGTTASPRFIKTISSCSRPHGVPTPWPGRIENRTSSRHGKSHEKTSRIIDVRHPARGH